MKRNNLSIEDSLSGEPSSKKPNSIGNNHTINPKMPKLPNCLHSTKCYRRNPIHFQQYAHPHLDELLENGTVLQSQKLPADKSYGVSDTIIFEQLAILSNMKKHKKMRDNGFQSSSQAVQSSSQTVPIVKPKPQTVAEKLNNGAPYNFFLTSIKASTATHNEPLTLTFEELLDPSLGDIESTLQINFMVDFNWLHEKYYKVGISSKPLLIIYGMESIDMINPGKLPPWAKAVRVKPKYPFGQHHTKMSIFRYTDGSVRVIIHTANLYGDDWENRTQGLWISPKCPPVSSSTGDSHGESPTNFRRDLMEYLTFYKVSELTSWIKLLQETDFSQINVWFIGSVPESHKDSDMWKWGQGKVKRVVSKHAKRGTTSIYSTIFQCSSIGSLGPDAGAWLTNGLGWSLNGGDQVRENQMKVVFPSHNNVIRGHDGPLSGGCVPYSRDGHSKQTWLEPFLHEWKSESRHRSRAIPHIKTYTCISNDWERITWFILTSANLSKAAWGMYNKSKTSLFIQSYEVGVLFLPRTIIGQDTFDATVNGYIDSDKKFPIPFTIPLSPYQDSDKPWFIDFLKH